MNNTVIVITTKFSEGVRGWKKAAGWKQALAGWTPRGDALWLKRRPGITTDIPTDITQCK